MTSRFSYEVPLIEKYARYGIYALIAGSILIAVAFITNQVPDPSFPWATLPQSLRIPIPQPRIERWPVTYTLGIWLWAFFLPALCLRGYARFGRGAQHVSTLWLVILWPCSPGRHTVVSSGPSFTHRAGTRLLRSCAGLIE